MTDQDAYSAGYRQALIDVGSSKILIQGRDFTLEFEPHGSLEQSYEETKEDGDDERV